MISTDGAFRAVAMWSESVYCCKFVAGVLRNLAADNEHNQRAISACHGIEAIVAAMQMHIAVAGVVEQGCSALCNLAFRE